MAKGTAGIVSDLALDILFRAARQHDAWLDRPVSDPLLRAVWELAKIGPVCGDGGPANVVFAKSAAAKEWLAPALPADRRQAATAAPLA